MRVLERDDQGRPIHMVFEPGERLPWPMPHEIEHLPPVVPASPVGVPAPQPPGLLRRAANFAKAAIQHAATGAEKAPEAAQALRLAICANCPLKIVEPVLGEVCTHPDCGCVLKIKASWADQKCPLDPPKWGPTASEAVLAASERLEALVAECDYRGGIVTAGGCGCTARWHCAMAKGDPGHPCEVTKAQCLQCVLGT